MSTWSEKPQPVDDLRTQGLPCPAILFSLWLSIKSSSLSLSLSLIPYAIMRNTERTTTKKKWRQRLGQWERRSFSRDFFRVANRIGVTLQSWKRKTRRRERISLPLFVPSFPIWRPDYFGNRGNYSENHHNKEKSRTRESFAQRVSYLQSSSGGVLFRLPDRPD